jgi:hypothetical protein
MVVSRGGLPQVNKFSELRKSGTLNLPHMIIMLSGAGVPLFDDLRSRLVAAMRCLTRIKT